MGLFERAKVLDRDAVLHLARARLNPFELLGVPLDASDEDVKRAYFALVRQLPRPSPDEREAAEIAFRNVGVAFETLRDGRSRDAYRQRLNPNVKPWAGATPIETGGPGDAEVRAQREWSKAAVARAATLLHGERIWDVIQTLEPTMGWLAGEDRTKARLLLATAYARNPQWLRRARELLQLLLRENPQNSEARALWKRLGLDPPDDDQRGGDCPAPVGGGGSGGGSPASVPLKAEVS